MKTIASLALLLGTAVAGNAIADSLNVCINKKTGLIRSARSCNAKETRFVIAVGPAGTNGAIGDNTATLAASVTALQTDITNIKAENTSLTTTVNTLQTAVANLQIANTNLTNRVDAAEAVNTAQTTNITTLQNNNIAGLSSVISYDKNTETVLFSGVNVNIVNGLNNTRAINGRGNLIIGYNEIWSNPRASYCSNGSFKTQDECLSPNVWGINQRSGSHNLILGSSNDYTMWGSIITGVVNTANNFESFILGGWGNLVSASGGGILSGSGNIASGPNSTIVGGWNHNTSGVFSTITGGSNNVSSADASSTVGGFNNVASGSHSSLSGGTGLSVKTNAGWAAGTAPNTFLAP